MTDHAFILKINRDYQVLFGKTTLAVLLVWGIAATAFYSNEGTTLLTLIFSVGTLLLSLFVMRLIVLIRGQRLFDTVRSHTTSIDNLIQEARKLEPQPVFFLSLVDGPLSGQRRKRSDPSTPPPKS